MGRALIGAGSPGLLCISRPASVTSFASIERLPLAAAFTSIGRHPFAPGFTANCFSSRLRPRCKDLSSHSPVRESDARISEEAEEDWVSSPSASPYQILAVDPAFCSPDLLKSAFRARSFYLDVWTWRSSGAKVKEDIVAIGQLFDFQKEMVTIALVADLHLRHSAIMKVKQFHPDVYKGAGSSDEIICKVINAYEMLSKHCQFESVERTGSDPFEVPECEACDVFVNELLCFGRGCPYSCVKRAPFAFSFTCENGTARAIYQGHDDYQVQLAVGQCPRKCIHYVTPSQRATLQDVLQRVLNNPFDMAEAAFLESLISKAMFENRRYQKPKRKPKTETEYVDWS